MKSLKLCLAAIMMAAVFMLTSCLNGGNTTGGIAYGVVEYSMDAFRNVVVVDDSGTAVYAPEFDNCQPNDCVGFVYKIDYDEQQSNKFLTATVSDYVVCDQWYSNSYVDTTKASLTPTEIAIDQVYSLHYVKGFLFANVGFKNISEDQKHSFTLSYDINEVPSTNENGNVYKLYVRSSVTQKGEKTPRDGSIMAAFQVKSYFDRLCEIERNNGKEFVQFKYVFINEMGKDKEFVTWKESEVSVLPIPQKPEVSPYNF